MNMVWYGIWPFPILKYKYIFQIKYTEAILGLSNSTRKLFGLKLANVDCSFKNKYSVLFIGIFGTLSFPIMIRISWSQQGRSFVRNGGDKFVADPIPRPPPLPSRPAFPFSCPFHPLPSQWPSRTFGRSGRWSKLPPFRLLETGEPV